MSNIALSGNASGTGTFTIASPNSNTDRTVNLPDAGGDMVLTTATQTLTNKTIQGGAITAATAVASTSGTSIDFTGIPSWVKRITVMFSGVSTNGTSIIQVQLGDSGGVETTGYVAGTSSFGSSAFASTSFTTGFGIRTSNSAGATYQGSLVLTVISGNTWVANGCMYENTNYFTALFGGNKTLSGTLDRVRITTVNGTDTFDAGTINILYEG